MRVVWEFFVYFEEGFKMDMMLYTRDPKLLSVVVESIFMPSRGRHVGPLRGSGDLRVIRGDSRLQHVDDMSRFQQKVRGRADPRKPIQFCCPPEGRNDRRFTAV